MDSLTFENTRISSKMLLTIQEEIYGVESNGYYLFKGFISSEQAEKIVHFWEHDSKRLKVPSFVGKNFHVGCTNFRTLAEEHNGNEVYYNFYWNKPVHELTSAVAAQIQIIRNQIEGRSKSLVHNFYPVDGYCAAFRIAISRNGSQVVKQHRDYVGTLKKDIERRTQATLILTKEGKDYTGNGFMLGDNADTKYVSVSKELSLDPGDLLIWKYTNLHEVRDVKSTSEQAGFVRMLFTPERVGYKPRKSLVDFIYYRVVGKKMRERLKGISESPVIRDFWFFRKLRKK